MQAAEQQHGPDTDAGPAAIGPGFDADDDDDGPEPLEAMNAPDPASKDPTQHQTGIVLGHDCCETPRLFTLTQQAWASSASRSALRTTRRAEQQTVNMRQHPLITVRSTKEQTDHAQRRWFGALAESCVASATGAQEAQAGQQSRIEPRQPRQPEIRDPYAPLDPHSAGDLPLRPFRKSKPRR